MSSNLSNGVSSFDDTSSGSLIEFFNRNVSTYPTDVGGPKFDLVPVTEQKDLMLNVARLYAQQEYDRIMETVAVLQKQAERIKHRLTITDMVHAAKYSFQTYHNQIYWLAFDSELNTTILTKMGPNDWTTGAPEKYQYVARVKWLGDFTWIEVNEQGEPV